MVDLHELVTTACWAETVRAMLVRIARYFILANWEGLVIKCCEFLENV
jgi:hypothetical protein